MAMRPEGANYQWRKIPPGELSIDPVADEWLVRVAHSLRSATIRQELRLRGPFAALVILLA